MRTYIHVYYVSMDQLRLNRQLCDTLKSTIANFDPKNYDIYIYIFMSVDRLL